VYCIGKPAKAAKAALLLSSASGSYDAAITQYKAFTGFTGIEDLGVCPATGEENKSEDDFIDFAIFISQSTIQGKADKLCFLAADQRDRGLIGQIA
jgi:hypothetical protein